eukprot:120055_1
MSTFYLVIRYFEWRPTVVLDNMSIGSSAVIFQVYQYQTILLFIALVLFTVAVLLRNQQQHIARYSATKCRITHRYNIDYYAKSRIFHGKKVLFGICLIKHSLVGSFLSYFIAANVGICIIYSYCFASKSCAFIDNETALLSFIFHHIL